MFSRVASRRLPLKASRSAAILLQRQVLPGAGAHPGADGGNGRQGRGSSRTSTDAFVDDDGHVLEGAINRLAAAGITFGCNPPANNRFCPDDTVTRAQAAGFLARALSIPASSTNHFVDDNGHVLEGAINRIADRGITLGCNPPTNNRFCPNDGVTRAQMAGMLTRALGLTPMSPPPRSRPRVGHGGRWTGSPDTGPVPAWREAGC